MARGEGVIFGENWFLVQLNKKNYYNLLDYLAFDLETLIFVATGRQSYFFVAFFKPFHGNLEYCFSTTSY